MGTSCEIARVKDGFVDQIHISYDGYLTGVGLRLFRHYGSEPLVDHLFGFDTGAPSLEATADDMSWGVWDEEYRGKPVADFLAQITREQHYWAKQYPDMHLDEDAALGIYVWAHGKWCYPRDTEDLRQFIETGESARVITRELLIADGAEEEQFTAEPHRPVDELTGVLNIPDDGDEPVTLDVGGSMFLIGPCEGFQISGKPEDWNGKRVRVRTEAMGFSSDGKNEQQWASIRSMELADA